METESKLKPLKLGLTRRYLSAHGNTYESAAANANEPIPLWIDAAKEFGDPIPRRKGHWIGRL